MQRESLTWLPTGRGVIENVIANAVLTLGAMLVAAIVTWWAEPNVPRAGVVIYFVCLALAFAIIWVLAAWGWRILYPAARADEAALKLAQATAKTLAPFGNKQGLRPSIDAANNKGKTGQEWTALDREERAKQIRDALAFIDQKTEPAVAEGRRLLDLRINILRERAKAPAYMIELANLRDDVRRQMNVVERVSTQYYPDIAAVMDASVLSSFISAVDNFAQTINTMMGLPEESKPEILLS